LIVSEEQEQGQQQKPRGEDTSKPVQEEAIQPHLSVWPFALAVALMVLLMGFITQPIILGIGVVLVIVAVIGWGVERR
jgi:hypothetical protein